MEKRDNYAISAAYARKLFLNYDIRKLAMKLSVPLDDDYLYVTMLAEPYRISRRTADVERQTEGKWIAANSFGEVMTLFDLVCDSQENRCLSHRWKNLRDFGSQFHRSLLEERNPTAERYEANAEAFCRACEALGGKPFPKGDAAYRFDVFEGMELLIQLWFGDEDFPAQLYYLWDENAKMYLKYETMYYCINLIQSRIDEKMKHGV